MNALLQRYIIDTEFSEVSGAEQLETLQVCDRLLKVETNLSEEEKERLAQADRRFIQHAPQVLRELSQCVDLAGLGRDRSLTAILIDTPIFSPSDHASKVANQI